MNEDLTLTFLMRMDGSQAKSELASVRAAVHKEVRSIGQEFASQIPVIGRFSSMMSPTALGIAAVGVAGAGVAAGFLTLAKHTANVGSRFHDLSTQSNLSVETLSGLELTIKQASGSLEDLTGGMFKLQQAQAKARDGSDQAAAALKRVGVDAKATSEDAIRQFITGLREIEDVGARNAAGAAVMGKGYKNLAVFVNESSESIDEVIEKSRAAGRVMSTEAAAAADELGDKIDELNYSLLAAGRTMISPALPAFIGALNDVTDASSDTAGGLREIGQAIASIIDGGRIAAGVLSAIADNDIRRIPAMYEAIKKEQRGRVFNAMAGTSGRMLGAAIGGGERDEDFSKGGKGGGSGKDDRAALIQEETRGIEREYRRQRQIINREQELQLTSLQDATARIIQAENDRYNALKDVLDKRLALAEKESEREGIHGELRDAELERDSNIEAATDARNKKILDAAKAHAQARLAIGEQYDADRIASIRAQADLRVLTYERAEEKIEEIQSAAVKRALEFNRILQKGVQLAAGFKFDEQGNAIADDVAQGKLDVQALEALQDEASKIIAAWDGAVVESERTRTDARRRDLENARAWAREIRELEWSVLRAALEVGQMDINRMRRNYEDRRDIARAQATHDREEEALRHADEMQRIEDRQRDFNEEVHTFEERTAALIAFHAARELERERHRRRMKEIDEEEKTESGEGDLLAPLKAVLAERISLHEFAANAIASSFRVITNAMGETLQTYILTGEMSGKLMRKAVAEQIAALAQLALKQGLYWTAQGIADLFWNPPRAAADFAAAAAFFAVAGGLAFVGRKVAGDAFKDQAQNGGSASGGSVGSGDNGGANYQAFNYNGGAQPSSAVAGEGSNNFWRRSVDEARREAEMQAALHRVAGAVERFSAKFDSISADELIVRNHHSIGNAVLEETRSNHDFNMELLRNTGQGR